MSKVLLINDSKFEGIIIKDILNTMGHDVKISDEYNAINQVKTYCPDFLIANYIMKDIRGDQLIALIKLSNPGIKCILSSSNDISEKDFEHRHIDAVIHTPVDKERMVGVFNKIKSNDVKNKQDDFAVPQEPTVQVVDVKPEVEAENSQDKSFPDEGVHEYDIVRFCPFCGCKLMEKEGEPVRFCAYCGHKL